MMRMRSLQLRVPSRKHARQLIALTAVLAVLALCIPLAVERIATSRTYQLFGGLINHVDTQRKVIALTFDDGPDENTDAIVKMLDALDVTATFYVIGSAIEEHPEYVRTLVRHGHELGNHSLTHRPLIGVSYTGVAKEVSATDKLIRNAGYYGPVTFRPPYGKKGAVLPLYLAAHERTTVMWSNHPENFAVGYQPTVEIVDRAVAEARPGDILLLHPWYGRENIRRAVPYIVAQLRAQGYEFVTVSQLRTYADLRPATE